MIEESEGKRGREVDRWVERARLAVSAAYGDPSPQMTRFDDIRYSPSMWSSGTPQSEFDRIKLVGLGDAVAMLRAFVEDLEESEGSSESSEPPSQSVLGNKVFVVHGHDDALREQVARLLERLGLEPVILHEHPDRGRTIIEKFEDHAFEVGYAVVLLTPDDFVREDDDPEWPLEPNQARQNVILELGYFMGKLGRARTAAIYARGARLPSDIHGLIYIAADDNWQLRLAKEMREAGLSVDLNRL